MDKIDAFDLLYQANERALALLKTAQEYGETVGADTAVMLTIDTVLDMLDQKSEAWDILNKAVCERV